MTEDNASKLDREGDIAADYLEELLDIADLDGDIEIGVEADRASVAIVSDDGGDRRLKRLIGRKGEALDSLQELTRLVVQQETGEPYSMKPMNPFERKVVHDVVADAGLFSDSSGTGPGRHVVIYLEDEYDDFEDADTDLDDEESDTEDVDAEETEDLETGDSAESADE